MVVNHCVRPTDARRSSAKGQTTLFEAFVCIVHSFGYCAQHTSVHLGLRNVGASQMRLCSGHAPSRPWSALDAILAFVWLGRSVLAVPDIPAAGSRARRSTPLIIDPCPRTKVPYPRCQSGQDSLAYSCGWCLADLRWYWRPSEATGSVAEG